jgi:hypothetical protein
MQLRLSLRRNDRHQIRSVAARRGETCRVVEVLEPRRLLSTTVNATDLNPPLTAGVAWTYQLTGGITGTQTQTVIGPGTFNGTSATEVDIENNFTSPTNVMSTVKNYLAFTSQGLIEYGTITIAPTVTTATAASPPLIEFPSTLTAGMPVTNTYAYASSSSNSSTTQTSSETVTLTLASGTPQSITVPAGTFSAYEVDDTTTGTASGTVQSWFAPNVGIVKQVISTSSQPVTQDLTSFTGATGGTGGIGGTGTTGSGALTPALKTPLPSSVVATIPLSSRNPLTLTASSAVKGAASAQVLLSKDTNPSDSAFTLASGHMALNLASGKSRSLPLRFAKSIPASVAPGTYNVLLVSTDPSGATQTAVSQQLTIAPATVDLTGSFLRAPPSVKAGQKVPLTFTIANSTAANVPASGVVQVQFETSSDGLLSDASVVDSVTKRIDLKPGKGMTFTVSLPLSATSFVVVDVDPGNAKFPSDANPANNVFATSQAIVVS